MPYIIVFVKFPSHIANEVSKRFMESLQKFPDDNSLGEVLVRSAVKTSIEGVNVLTVTRVNEGKLEDALRNTNNQIAFFVDIEGYEASIEVWGTVQETLATLGMKMP
ncbi:MAG: hypothetical protein ACW96X_06970 [Promethearchaeota archaeon]|jgi:hypothetical protein